MYSEPSSPDPLNACTFCGRQQLPEDEFNHIKNTLHHLTLPELENRGFCCVCLNEQNILWQLITDHDDIFQTHIVGKLAGADLKFLNQANSESREALKRSKRVATVPEKFNGAWSLSLDFLSLSLTFQSRSKILKAHLACAHLSLCLSLRSRNVLPFGFFTFARD